MLFSLQRRLSLGGSCSGSGSGSVIEPTMAVMTVLLLLPGWMWLFGWKRLSCNSGQSKSYSAGKDVCLCLVVVVVEISQMWL